MAYDPCGSEKLTGEAIIRLLAKELVVDATVLKQALLKVLNNDRI